MHRYFGKRFDLSLGLARREIIRDRIVRFLHRRGHRAARVGSSEHRLDAIRVARRDGRLAKRRVDAPPHAAFLQPVDDDDANHQQGPGNQQGDE